MPPATGAQIPTSDLIKLEWRFLIYGALMSFWSSIGQTFFISLFSLEIREELSLSHGEFGSIYAAATMLSAVTLFWLGKQADNLTVFRLSLITIIALTISAIFFKQGYMVSGDMREMTSASFTHKFGEHPSLFRVFQYPLLNSL